MSTFDGGLYLPSRKDRTNKNTNAQFILNMLKENLDYVEWVAEVLQKVTGCSIKDRKDYNVDGCSRKEQVRLESRRHPFLTKLRNRIYTIENKKVIDPHMLKLMDAEALAIIFMTDGGSYHDKRTKKSISFNLHTKGFSHADNMALSKAIFEKLGIKTTVQRHYNYYFLRISSKDNTKFIKTILPFMKESFLYKFERLAPALDDDIVWSLKKLRESYRNDRTSVKAEVTKTVQKLF